MKIKGLRLSLTRMACYRNSLTLALKHGIGSIAFPGISTGIYGYPIEPAVRIAVTTCAEFLVAHDHGLDVIFCCFSPHDLSIYKTLLHP